MNLTCFECGNPADHMHHVVPKSLGGTKTVPLCETCHGLAHGNRSKYVNHRQRIREGIDRARAKGIHMGRPRHPRMTREQVERVLDTDRSVACQILDCSYVTLLGALRKYGFPIRSHSK